MGVEETKYPNNSYASKAKANADNNQPEVPRVKPVVSGPVKRKKKGFGSKIAELFVAGDSTDLKRYILYDVAIPALKGFAQDALDIVLNGSAGGRPRSSYRGTGSYVSYGSYYGNSRKKTEPEAPRCQAFRFENVILETRGEAESVMDNLYYILDDYSVVRVADLYDLCGIDHRSHTDVRFGWTSLEGAAIVRGGGGYMLKLPQPRTID